MVFGCEQCHTYIYGYQFIIESDHKPHGQILWRSHADVTVYLQLMMLCFQPYNFDLTHIPGYKIHTFWCLVVFSPQARTRNLAWHHHVWMSTECKTAMQNTTGADPEPYVLAEMIIGMWPEYSEDLFWNFQKYHSSASVLITEDGPILKGKAWLKLPPEHDETLQCKHEGHYKHDLLCRIKQRCTTSHCCMLKMLKFPTMTDRSTN